MRRSEVGDNAANSENRRFGSDSRQIAVWTAPAVENWITRLRQSTVGELAWLGLLCLAGLRLVGFVVVALMKPDSQMDFVMFIDSARSWATTREPYAYVRTPGLWNLNPPHVTILFLPFTWVSLYTASGIWLGLSLASAIIAWYLMERYGTGRLPVQTRLLLIALILLSRPMDRNLTNGQIGLMLWLAFSCAWVLSRTARPRLGGAVIGALATVKPFFGLWLPYYVYRRQWHALSGACVGISGSLLAGLAVTGPAAWVSWSRESSSITWYHFVNNASIYGTIARTMGRPDIRAWGVVAIALLATTVWALRRTDDADQEWALLILAALLLSPLAWSHYLFLPLTPGLSWLYRVGLRRADAAAWGALLFCPGIGADAGSAIVRATTGSLRGWSLLATWGMAATRDQPDDVCSEPRR